MIKNDATYDKLKFIAQILLPGLGALYFSLAGIWSLPEPDKVVGTITVIDVFLGLLLKRSSDAYNESDAKFDGSVNIQETKAKTTVELGLDTPPEELENADEVLLKVNKETPVKVTAKKTVKKRIKKSVSPKPERE